MDGLRLETERAPNGIVLGEDGLFRARDSRRDRLRLETFDLHDSYVVQFINSTDDDARAAFLTAYGCLFPGRHDCSRKAFFGLQRDMRQLLKLAGADEAKDRANALNKDYKLTEQHESDAIVSAMADRGRLVLQVASLFGLMRQECMLVIDRGVRFDTCDQCGIAYLTGSTTSRKSHAQYCSPRCRMRSLRARGAA